MTLFSLSLPWPFRAEPRSEPNSNLDRAVQDDDATARETLELLRHFEGSDSVLPPSARIDPTVRQRERQRLGVFDVWKYGAFLAVKTLGLTTALVKHCVWGPKKKSWGWEMTFVSTVMQNATDHSHLADIAVLRRLISMLGYAPLPSDAMITPVTFPVRRRKLRGILADLDRLEDGKRELSGEWVVGRKLWKKLQTEWRASKASKEGGASTPKSNNRKDRVILYLHGGAYYMFSAATHRLLTIQLAKYTDSRLFAVDYRLAPEVRFPGQIHDAASAYMRLLDLQIPPQNIIISGDSAGGCLALSLMMYLRDNNYPLPSAAILMSPWVDLTMSCDSWDTNAAFDIIPQPKAGDHLNPISCYLGEDLEKLVAHPYASPLFGDFHGLPPILLQAGDSEVLRDEITLLAHKARLAGVQVQYELYEDGVHVFQQFPFLDISRRAFQAFREFVKRELPRLQEGSPQNLGDDIQTRLIGEIDNENTRKVDKDGLELSKGSSTSSPEADDVDFNINQEGSKEQSKEDRDSDYEAIKGRPASQHGNYGQSPLRRLSFKPVQEKPEESSEEPAEPRLRNHQRHATYRPPPLSTPAPSIRTRARAISHPDISSLCQQWADSAPSERSLTMTYIPASRPSVRT